MKYFLWAVAGMIWASSSATWAAKADTKPCDSYHMDLSVDPSKGRLQGDMLLRWRNEASTPLSKLRLRLDSNLSGKQRLDIIRVEDGVRRPLNWQYQPLKFAKFTSDKGAVEITLASPVAPSQEARLSIQFRSTGDHLKADTITLQDDPFQSLDGWYPKVMTPLGDGWSMDDDRLADYDVTLRIDPKYTVASTGRQVNASLPADNQGLHLNAERVRGFSIYASRSWQRHVKQSGQVEIGICLPAEAAGLAERILDAAGDAIAFYEKEYAAFPTRHLDIICPGKLNDRAHGSSAACNVLVVFLGGNLMEQYRFLVAHEVAHMYFGSSIGLPRTSIGWVPVGVGLMMDEHYAVARGLDANYGRKMMREFYFRAEQMGFDTTLSQSVERPMQSPPPWSFGWNMSLAHGKGYAVCAMLRDLLGPEKFQDVIRKLIEERSGGLIRDKDLIDACEAALGQPLDWFTADWIDGRATLDYAVTGARKTNDGWDVLVKRVGTGSFPALVELTTGDGLKLHQRLNQSATEETLHFKTAGSLKSVRIDPEGVYPDLHDADNVWPRVDKNAPAAVKS